jgi:hypothetical protein
VVAAIAVAAWVLQPEPRPDHETEPEREVGRPSGEPAYSDAV